MVNKNKFKTKVRTESYGNDSVWRSKTIDISFFLFFYSLSNLFLCNSNFWNTFSIMPVLSYIETILSLFVESSKKG